MAANCTHQNIISSSDLIDMEKIIYSVPLNGILGGESIKNMFYYNSNEQNAHWLLDYLINIEDSDDKLQEFLENNIKQYEDNLFIKNNECLNTEIKK